MKFCTPSHGEPSRLTDMTDFLTTRSEVTVRLCNSNAGPAASRSAAFVYRLVPGVSLLTLNGRRARPTSPSFKGFPSLCPVSRNGPILNYDLHKSSRWYRLHDTRPSLIHKPLTANGVRPAPVLVTPTSIWFATRVTHFLGCSAMRSGDCAVKRVPPGRHDQNSVSARRRFPRARDPGEQPHPAASRRRSTP
jgi:hypothetical protein